MSVDRALFTPFGMNPNCPVPFGPNQTVPTEAMVRLLAEAVGHVDRVLEIGTGSGYQAAVLAERCGEVVSIEVQPLPDGLADKLPANVTLIRANGCTRDLGEQFDAVIITFAAREIYPAWIKHVREGGKLIVPVEYDWVCKILVSIKRNGQMVPHDILAYAPFTQKV